MKSRVVASILILTLLFTFALGSSVVGAESPTFSLKPATAYARTGTSISFRLMAYNITDMNSWTVRIEWDPAIITLHVAPFEGDALNEGWMESTFTSTNGTGYLEMTDSLTGDNVGDSVTFDEGLLAIFYLRAVKLPPEAGTTVSIASAEYKDPTGVPTTPAVEHAVVKPPAPGVTVIEWLTHWTSVAEMTFWDQCIAEFEAENPKIHVVLTSVDFESLYDVIMTRFAAGEDPDLIHIHAMWVPKFVTKQMLSTPPPDVQTEVETQWTEDAKDGATFLGTIWGYPTEYNSWALVWNKKIFAEVGLDPEVPPTSWGIPSIGEGELETMAVKCTTRDEFGVINRTGFYPVFDSSPEEERFQFMSLLWSNGGEYIDFNKPEATFNSKEGVEVLELYKWCRDKTFDPIVHPAARVWWEAWEPPYELAIMVLPTWMTYIRDAMGEDFTPETIGIAPVPVGPSGVSSESVVYSWMATVTKRAEQRVDYTGGPTHAEAAWTFLKWINEPKPTAAPYGAQPEATWVTRMGDYLLTDMIIPSRKSDQENFPICTENFWFKEFINIGALYGRSDTYFRTSEEVQETVFYMCEYVATEGSDPKTEADKAAAAVNKLLPIPGDINGDDVVDIFDIVTAAKAFGSKPGDPKWNPNADVNSDDIVDIFDVVSIAVNFGVSH